jgi:hypothetical protein
MTPKERMMTALRRQKPDRLPVTIHQWMQYHLKHFMGGVDQLEAYRACGLDASFTIYPHVPMKSLNWQYRCEDMGIKEGERFTRYVADTPGGQLTWTSAQNEYTCYVVEHPVKNKLDADNLLAYWPGFTMDKSLASREYDRVGDDGIVRGSVLMWAQVGGWQDFCEMVGTQDAIYWAMDDGAWLHDWLTRWIDRKVEWIYREMPGIKFDLIELGGGAGSSTVISPAMFDEFCVPYDRRVVMALREVGFPTVYHTCGGMMAILDRIPNNGADASETLSPPGVGGDIKTAEDRVRVKKILGSRMALIGGIDQSGLLTTGTPAEIAAGVKECFETFGKGGGYICSASDHFFHSPVENLKAMARAARECRY